MGLLDMGLKFALSKVRDNVINPKLAGIGEVEEISWKNGTLFGRVKLADLEDHPLEVYCSDISIANDGSSVRIGSFKANKRFMQAALDNYVAGKPIPVPDGAARLALGQVKKFLNL